MNKKTIAHFCAVFTVFAAAVAAVLETLSVLLSYQNGSNYFDPGAILPTLATVWSLLAFVTAVIFAIAIPKAETAPSPFGKKTLISLPAALGFGCGAVCLIAEFIKTNSLWALVTALLLLLSAAHVYLCETDRKNPALGFVPSVSCALLIAILYFDASLEMNAPMKVATQTALLPLMLYFTTELRYLLNRELPRLYLALALISVAPASLCVLSVPVVCLMGALKNINCLAAALVVAGVNITILLKLKRYLHPIPSPENDTKETDAQ